MKHRNVEIINNEPEMDAMDIYSSPQTSEGVLKRLLRRNNILNKVGMTALLLALAQAGNAYADQEAVRTVTFEGMKANVIINLDPPITGGVTIMNEQIQCGTEVAPGVKITDTTGTISDQNYGKSIRWFLMGAPVDSFSYSMTVDAGYYGEMPLYGLLNSKVEATGTVPANIMAQPQSKNLVAGDSVTLGACVLGEGFSYQWYKDGSPIDGANDVTLNIKSAAGSDAGDYYLTVTDADNNVVTSETATLGIVVPPTITVPPEGATVATGSTYTLSVEAEGTTPFSYQWYKLELSEATAAEYVAIEGATSASYVIENAQKSDAGRYRVTVSNAAGEQYIQTSDEAVIKVYDLPEIEKEPEPPSGGEMVVGSAYTFRVQVESEISVSYQWYKNGEAIPGATKDTYTVENATAADAGEYTVKVTSEAGTVESEPVELVVITEPVITLQPQSQTGYEDKSVTFTVEAEGLNLSYQWKKDGADIPAATDATYMIPEVKPADEGEYTVIVTNPAGSVPSQGAVLTIVPKPTITTQPVGDTVNEGEPYTFTVAADDAETYQWYKDGTPITGATGVEYAINETVTDNDGSYTVVVSNGAGDVESTAAVLTVRAKVRIETQPASQTINEDNSVTFSVVATGADLEYQWYKGQTEIDGAKSASYSIATVKKEDAGSYTVLVKNDFSQEVSAAAVLEVTDKPQIKTQPVGATVNEDDSYTFSVVATGADLEYQWLKDGQEITGANAASYTIQTVKPEDAAAYTVVVSNSADTVTSAEAVLTVIEKIRITTQPVGATINEDDSVTFSVTVTGTDPQYQWYKDGAELSGATSATYAIQAVKPEDAGTYTVTVSNDANEEISNEAVLTVIEKIRITTQPVSQTINEDDSVTLSVVVTGTDPQYQWFKDGDPIDEATESEYTIEEVTPEDAGIYTVTVSNDANEVTSEEAELIVNEKPRIVTQPEAEVTVFDEDSVTFSVEATGYEPLTYQWYKDGEPIDEATESEYTIDPVSLEDAGTYTVVVSNEIDDVESDESVLTVTPRIILVPSPESLPESLEITSGERVVLEVVAEGADNIQYQWYWNETPIEGANQSVFVIENAGVANTGEYYAVLTSGNTVVTSDTAVLTVNKADQVITFLPVNSIYPEPTQLVAVADSGLQVTFTSSNPEVVVIEGDMAWAIDNGIVTITAIQEGDEEHNPAQVDQIVTAVFRKYPVILWNPAPLTYGTPLGGEQLNATAVDENGETLEGTFVYDPKEGTQLEQGKQTLFATFTPADTRLYYRVSGRTEVLVGKADQTITLTVDPTELNVGESTQISAASTSGLDVTITISDESILSKSGKALAAGTVTITATQDGNDNYNAAKPVSQTVTVTQKEIVTVTVQSETITYGDAAPKYAYTMEPKVEGVSVTLDCSYKQGDDAGTYPITATVTADEKYTVEIKNGTLIVEQVVPDVTIGEADPTMELPVVEITYGDLLTDELANAEADVEGNFTYEVVLLDGTTDTEKVLDIDPTVELVSAGEYLLKATFTPADSTNYATVVAYAIFGVDQFVPTVTVEDAEFEFGMLITDEDLNATVLGLDGEPVEGTIEFYVDAIALSELKQPLAVRAYPLTAQFISADPNYADAESEVAAALIVSQADVVVVTWQPKTDLTYGESIALDAVATVNGKKIASGDELTYTVKFKGELYSLEEGLILDAGEYEVMAEYVAPLGGGYADARTEWISVTVNQAVPTLTWVPAPMVYGEVPGYAQENATADVEGEFDYPEMSGLDAGQYKVTATFTSADPNFANGEVTAILKVTKATPEIRWATPAPINYGTLLSDEQLNASANVDGTFVYTPAAGTELDIGTYTLIAEFTPKDTANYTTATASVELEVIPNVEVEITWEPKSPITYGTVLSVEQLNATANVEGHFYYNPTYGFVVTPESKFVVNGKLKLAVTFVPTDRKHFKNAYKEVFIDIVTDEDDDEDTTDDGDEAPALNISKAGSVKGMVNAAADALVITFTGTLEESTDGVTWKPVADAKDGTYLVDIKSASKKFYRSVK